MDSLSYKTNFINKQNVTKNWWLVDASNLPLGRVASQIAHRLRGKHKTTFSPHVDCGDKVIVINADKVRLTGNKWEQKVFTYHTGYPGGQKQPTYKMIKEKNPSKVIEIAVKGMLPKNKLGRKIFKSLYVFNDENHRFENQKIEQLHIIK